MNYHLLLSLGYVLPVALGLWLYFKKQMPMPAKLLLAALLPLVYFLHWVGLKETEGWPTGQSLPIQFELISADIVESNKLMGVEGSIHLWVRPDGHRQPRSYRLAYSRDLHKKLFETKQRIDQGYSQLGILYEEESGGKGVSLGSGKRLDFEDSPASRLPAKRG